MITKSSLSQLFNTEDAWMNPFSFETFTHMNDRLSSIFFSNNDIVPQFFAELTETQMEALPFGGIGSHTNVLHYGGDYIITYNTKTMEYVFHFIIPGHNKDSVEISRINNRLTIKNKENSTSASERLSYRYYKSIPLIRETYVVTSATMADGILSLTVMDKGQKEVQKIEIRETPPVASNTSKLVLEDTSQSESPLDT